MKKAVIFLLPVLVGGGVVGLGLAGVVNIPGLTPKKKPVAATKEPEKPKPKVTKRESPPETKATASDPVKGYEAVAKLWNELEGPKLLAVTEKWKDQDLAPILMRMDPDKVVELLALVPPDRANRLSRAIQALASSS
jgi:hypothetical protein